MSAPARRAPKAALTLTPAAVERVKDLLAKKSNQEFVRIGVKKGGCAGMEYVFDISDELDAGGEMVEQDGARVGIEGTSLLFLLGSTLDYQISDLHAKFILTNPNQTDACGCGESVTLSTAELKDYREQQD